MFGSNVLEVATGVVFIYLIVSLLCTSINEGIASLTNRRGRNLFLGIKNLLNDPAFTGLANRVYNHGLVAGISKEAINPEKKNRLPSYMSSENFSLALLHILGSHEIPEDGVPQLEHIQAGINKLPEGHTKESLSVLLEKTRREVRKVEDQAEHFRKNVETWFNDSMDRIGGWYKRWTQWWLLGIAAVLVVLLNVDTLMLVQRFSVDRELRTSIMASAKSFQSAHTASTTSTESDSTAPLELTSRDMESLNYLGWSRSSRDLSAFPWVNAVKNPNATSLKERYDGYRLLCLFAAKIFGLLISMGAVSLGAPFWFDMLSKVINIRGTGTPPGEAKKGKAKEES